MFRWMSKLFGGDNRPNEDRRTQRRHSFEEIKRSEISYHTRSKCKKRCSPEPKRRRSDEPPLDIQKSLKQNLSEEESKPVNNQDNTEKMWEKVDIPDHCNPECIVIADPPSPDNPIVVEKPTSSVWEASDIKEKMYKDCVVIETSSEYKDRLLKECLLPDFPADDGVRMSTGIFVNIDGISDALGTIEKRKDGNKNENAPLEKGCTNGAESENMSFSYVQIDLDENSAEGQKSQVILNIGDELKVDTEKGNFAKDDKNTEPEICSNIDPEKSPKYVVPKMPLSQDTRIKKSVTKGEKRKSRKTPEKVTKEKKNALSEEKENSDQKAKPVESSDQATYRKDIENNSSDIQENTEDDCKIAKSEMDKLEQDKEKSDKVTKKYVIPSRRNKDPVKSPEKTDQVEHKSEPKNFLEFVNRKNAQGIIVDAKKMMFELGFLKDVDQTEIETAVIQQYKMAVDRKYYPWIKEARYNAELIFSQKWIEDNLPTLGAKKDKKNDWRKKKQERRQREYSEYENKAQGGICRDIRLGNDPSLQVVRENVGTKQELKHSKDSDDQDKLISENANVEASDRTSPTKVSSDRTSPTKVTSDRTSPTKVTSDRTSPTKVSSDVNPCLETAGKNQKPIESEKDVTSSKLKNTDVRSSRFKYTDVRLETNPHFDIVRENFGESSKQKSPHKYTSPRLKYTDVRLDTNPNLEVVRENAGSKFKTNAQKSSSKDTSRSSRLKSADDRLETNRDSQIVGKNVPDKDKKSHNKDQKTSAERPTSSKFKYTDVRLETNPDLPVVKENAAEKPKLSQTEITDAALNSLDLGENSSDVKRNNNSVFKTNVCKVKEAVVERKIDDLQEFGDSSAITRASTTVTELEVKSCEEKLKMEPNDEKSFNTGAVEGHIPLAKSPQKSELVNEIELRPDTEQNKKEQIENDSKIDENVKISGNDSLKASGYVCSVTAKDGGTDDVAQTDIEKSGTYKKYSEVVKASTEPNNAGTKQSIIRKEVSSSLNSLLAIVENEISKTFDSNGNPISVNTNQCGKNLDAFEKSQGSVESETNKLDKNAFVAIGTVDEKRQECVKDEIKETDACIISEVIVREKGDGFIVNTKLEEEPVSSNTQFITALGLVPSEFNKEVGDDECIAKNVSQQDSRPSDEPGNDISTKQNDKLSLTDSVYSIVKDVNASNAQNMLEEMVNDIGTLVQMENILKESAMGKDETTGLGNSNAGDVEDRGGNAIAISSENIKIDVKDEIVLVDEKKNRQKDLQSADDRCTELTDRNKAEAVANLQIENKNETEVDEVGKKSETDDVAQGDSNKSGTDDVLQADNKKSDVPPTDNKKSGTDDVPLKDGKKIRTDDVAQTDGKKSTTDDVAQTGGKKSTTEDVAQADGKKSTTDDVAQADGKNSTTDDVAQADGKKCGRDDVAQVNLNKSLTDYVAQADNKKSGTDNMAHTEINKSGTDDMAQAVLKKSRTDDVAPAEQNKSRTDDMAQAEENKSKLGDIELKDKIPGTLQTDVKSIEKGLKDLITEMAAKEKKIHEDKPNSASASNTGSCQTNIFSPLAMMSSSNPRVVRSCEHLPNEVLLSDTDSIESLSVKSESGDHSYSKSFKRGNRSRIQQPKSSYSYSRSYESLNTTSAKDRNWHYPSTPGSSGSSRHDGCKQPTPGRYDRSFNNSPRFQRQQGSYTSRYNTIHSGRYELGNYGRGASGNTPRGMYRKQNYNTPKTPKHVNTGNSSESFNKYSQSGSVWEKKSGMNSEKPNTVEKHKKNYHSEKYEEINKSHSKSSTVTSKDSELSCDVKPKKGSYDQSHDKVKSTDKTSKQSFEKQLVSSHESENIKGKSGQKETKIVAVVEEVKDDDKKGKQQNRNVGDLEKNFDKAEFSQKSDEIKECPQKGADKTKCSQKSAAIKECSKKGAEQIVCAQKSDEMKECSQKGADKAECSEHNFNKTDHSQNSADNTCSQIGAQSSECSQNSAEMMKNPSKQKRKKKRSNAKHQW